LCSFGNRADGATPTEQRSQQAERHVGNAKLRPHRRQYGGHRGAIRIVQRRGERQKNRYAPPGVFRGIVIVTINPKGFGWIPTEWSPHWDRQPWFSLDPHVRVSMFGTIVSLGLWQIATAGGDQTAVQRFTATSSARAARRSYLINAITVIVVTVVQALSPNEPL